MDAEKLALAREAARERGIGNVDFRTGNVNDFDEPAAYDVVYCRFLLQHLVGVADAVLLADVAWLLPSPMT